MKVQNFSLTHRIYPFLNQEDEPERLNVRCGYIEVVTSRSLSDGNLFGKVSLSHLRFRENLLNAEMQDQLIAALNKAKELTEEVETLKS